jgi:hypothetical protein
VFIAENQTVLERVVALEVVAASDRRDLRDGSREALRERLLDEEWGFAIQEWMGETNTVIDFYPDEAIWLDSDITEERAALDVRMSRLFSDPD